MDILLQIALNFGLPFLLSKFPWLPASIAQVLTDLVEQLKKVKKDQKAAVRLAKAEAFNKIRARRGVGSPPDTVG